MFGYIVPDKANLYVKDFQVYNAFYCSLCKALSREGNQLTRLSANYDATFFDIFIHSLLRKEVAIKSETCMIAMKKKNVVKIDDLTIRVADVAVLLLYYSLTDDILDGKKSRRIIRTSFVLRTRKAKKREPIINTIIEKSYKKLRELEKEKCTNIDKVADTSAKMLQDITCQFKTLSYEESNFIYNIGKLIYLFDAVDDIEEDTKNKTYNPVILSYGSCVDKKEYLNEHKDEVSFLLNSAYSRIVECYNKMEVIEFEGILSNIIYLGIRNQIDTVLSGEKRCGYSQRV